MAGWFASWRDFRAITRVSDQWLENQRRLDTLSGWLHPSMPRWKSPREIKHERTRAWIDARDKRRA